MKQSEIKFTVTLDTDKNPERIEWSASDANKAGSSKAVMISLWDSQEQNTLRIDLWTKEMTVEDMNRFYYQNLMAMADTLERSTSEKEAPAAMRAFAEEFGRRMKVLAKSGAAV